MKPCQRCGSALANAADRCGDCGRRQAEPVQLQASSESGTLTPYGWSDILFGAILIGAIGYWLAGDIGAVCGAIIGAASALLPGSGLPSG